MSLPIRLLHLPIAAVLLTHCSLGSNPDGMPDSAQAAVERARQELGLLGDEHAAGVPVQLDAATLPFLSRQWKGRNAWRVDIVQPRWPALVLPNVVPRKVDLPYVQALSVLIDQSSGAVVRVNSVWPERETPIAPYPPIAVEERQLADHEERFRPPSSPARISLARALAVIGANGGDLAHTRQILAYHVFHKTLQYSEREVWIVQLRGIPVASKYSCGALIKLEQTPEAFVTANATGMSCWWRKGGREKQLVAFALVRAFEMIMLDKLSDCSAQRGFTKEDQLR